MRSAVSNRVLATRSYVKLVALFPPRIIENARQYKTSIAVIEKMMDAKSLSQDQAAYLELLCDLVETYERKHYSIGEPSLGELLAHLIEASGATKAEVARAACVSASLISDVLGGRRGMSLEVIRRLSAYFGLDASLFVEASAGPQEAA